MRRERKCDCSPKYHCWDMADSFQVGSMPPPPPKLRGVATSSMVITPLVPVKKEEDGGEYAPLLPMHIPLLPQSGPETGGLRGGWPGPKLERCPVVAVRQKPRCPRPSLSRAAVVWTASRSLKAWEQDLMPPSGWGKGGARNLQRLP